MARGMDVAGTVKPPSRVHCLQRGKAHERDEQAIARWRKVLWPRKERAADAGKSVLLLDESGLKLQPLVRRTWAPAGQRPVMYCWDRHDRVSVIAGLSLSAGRGHVGLYFALHPHNVKAEEVEAFVRQVQRRLGKDLVVIMDRLGAHRSAAGRLARDKRFEVEWLPAYAPDLNPVEAAWS